jgi:cold shock protein
MARGTVKWFNPAKGYGFIQPSGGGGGKDVFLHPSAVEASRHSARDKLWNSKSSAIAERNSRSTSR